MIIVFLRSCIAPTANQSINSNESKLPSEKFKQQSICLNSVFSDHLTRPQRCQRRAASGEINKLL